MVFQDRLNALLSDIPKQVLAYETNEVWMYQDFYDEIMGYAIRKELINTALALHVVRGLLQGYYRGTVISEDGTVYERPLFYHCLITCSLLMNMHMPLEEGEEDILLASALSQEVLTYVPFPEYGEEMTELYHLDERVTEVIQLVNTSDCETGKDLVSAYTMIQDHKLAFLVGIANCSHMMEELSRISVGKVHEYIYDTRNYWFSMCIHAREKFQELEPFIIILQEKTRMLIEVAEIFVERYEKHVKEMNAEIVAWEDDNYRLRKRLRKAGYDPQGRALSVDKD